MIPILVLVILTPHINCINLLYCKCIGVCEDESGGQDQLTGLAKLSITDLCPVPYFQAVLTLLMGIFMYFVRCIKVS